MLQRGIPGPVVEGLAAIAAAVGGDGRRGIRCGRMGPNELLAIDGDASESLVGTGIGALVETPGDTPWPTDDS